MSLSWGKDHTAGGEVADLLLIGCVWLGMAILVRPIGEFPLNDDWVYARAVQSIIETGHFDLSQGPGTPNLISQAFWGALFCLPYGFSFTALRFSTLVLGLLGVLCTYGLLREASAGRGLSLLGAFLLAFNPIYFGLSNTFMTDVPFCAIATLSLLMLMRGLRREAKVEILVGILLSFVALLIRQIGIFIPMAFAIAFLWKRGVSVGRVILACLPTLAGLLIQYGFQTWLQVTGRSSPLLGLQARQVGRALLSRNVLLAIDFPKNTVIALIYLGAFLAPFLIVLAARLAKGVNLRKRTVALIILATFCILAAVGLSLCRSQLPMVGNVLNECGLGPVKVRKLSTECDDSAALALLRIGWTGMTAAGLAGACLLCFCTLHGAWRMWRGSWADQTARPTWLGALILSASAIYLFPLGVNGYFDRYLLPLVPLWMAYLCWYFPGSNFLWHPGRRAVPVLAVLLIFGVFTLGASHDYLSWNRIRWRAANELTEKYRISPHYIDGGLEFNGWYLYKFGYVRREGVSMWVDKDDYVISAAALPGYLEQHRYPAERWLPFGVREVYVLQKAPPR